MVLRFLGKEKKEKSRTARTPPRRAPRPHSPERRTAKHIALQAVVALFLTIAVGAFVYNVPSGITGMATFNAKGCNNQNQICDVITECNAGGTCTSRYENCQSCGVSTKVCGDGVAVAQNQCRSGNPPSCVNSVPVCTSAATSDPHKVLTFSVFTRKNLMLNVTPASQAGTAGSTLNYRVTVENKNPKALEFVVSSEAPTGWTVDVTDKFTVGENSKRDIVVRITSNQSTSEGEYPVIIGFFNAELGLFGTAQPIYVVGIHTAPAITTTPKTNTGFPGQTVKYNVSVTNTDPEGFDASTFSLRAGVPPGFNGVFSPTSLRIAPQQSGSSILSVTSSLNASETSYPITVNASVGRLTGLDFLEYKVDLCGNNVCDLDEENSCALDCPTGGNIICNGRCESAVDDGLFFTADVNSEFTKFIICSRNSTMAACANAARTTSGCGVGKPCLCSGKESECKAICVDSKGVYYAMAEGAENVRTPANYSFACPFVDLAGFKAMRADFAKAKADYEKAQSALAEVLRGRNVTATDRSRQQPCVDALGTISGRLDLLIKHFDAVIRWPGIANTTAARAAADDTSDFIGLTYNTYCQGATGLLQIQQIDTTTVEKGVPGSLTVNAVNFGTTDYFGFPACDLTGAAGERITVEGTCSAISGGTPQSFNVPLTTTSAGLWRARCRMMGSLSNDCSLATIHDDKPANFSSFTKETFVVDVSGACTVTGDVSCSVKTTRGGCGACALNGVACTKIGTSNNTDQFNCPTMLPGTYTLTGSVISSASCIPIEPTTKNATVKCAGCGDGTVDRGEQCELPYTDNNARCTQTESICEGRLFGIRDNLGFCSLSCSCSLDAFDFSCTRGRCGAECQDGETRVVTLNKTGGTCTCTQQCGSTCGWNACDCEPGSSVTLPGNGTFVQVSHTPANPTPTTPVTLTVVGRDVSLAEIYVDGFIVQSCTSFPCSITAAYDRGVHTYFARGVSPTVIVTDPVSGSKAFTVGNGTSSSSSGNTTTGLNTSTVMVDVSHSPVSITTATPVTLSAVANGPRSFRSIQIFVDGEMKKECTNYPRSLACTYRANFPQGSHTYNAIATDVSGVTATDSGGTFSVASTSGTIGIGTGSTGSAANGTVAPPAGFSNTTPTGRCYASIEARSCTYNEATRRYDVYLSAAWNNGTHAHWKIDGDESPRLYSTRFNHTKQVSAPGLKEIRLEVHNVNDTLLCYDTEQVYCGPGTTTGKDVDVLFDVKNVLPMSLSRVKIIAIPTKDIDFAGLFVYTDSSIELRDPRVEGNRSEAGLSGPVRVVNNGSYSLYTLTTGLQAGRNITLTYNILPSTSGRFKFMVIANHSGKSDTFTKTVDISSCPNTNSVIAMDAGGNCRSFPTICDVPSGWNTVERCTQVQQQPQGEGESPLGSAIAIILIVVILGVGYRYRDRIRERLRRTREEVPTIDFGDNSRNDLEEVD